MIGDVLPVRRIHGLAVEARLRGDALDFATSDRDRKQIAIGADGFHFAGDSGKTNFFAVGREIDVVRAAALIGRNVVVGASGEVARSSAAIGGNDEEVGALAFVPVGPVTIEKMLGDVGLHFVLFLFGVTLAVAVVVFAIRIDGGSESNGFSIGRPLRDISAR